VVASTIPTPGVMAMIGSSRIANKKIILADKYSMPVSKARNNKLVLKILSNILPSFFERGIAPPV
jgi:hypothetical protein